VRGQPTRTIATALQLSPHTIQDHVRHICEKLGVGSRRQLGALLLGTLTPTPAAADHRPECAPVVPHHVH
jgi:hypothetical protein